MDTENNPSQSGTDKQELMIRQFLETQKQEAANKSKELDIQAEGIKSNERIALASIAAQQEDTATRGQVFADAHKRKMRLFAIVAVLVTIIILYAISADNTEVALELIKIGGAVLLGYFAGVNKGKADALDQTRQRETE